VASAPVVFRKPLRFREEAIGVSEARSVQAIGLLRHVTDNIVAATLRGNEQGGGRCVEARLTEAPGPLFVLGAICGVGEPDERVLA
jgi:hypothetical protein